MPRDLHLEYMIMQPPTVAHKDKYRILLNTHTLEHMPILNTIVKFKFGKTHVAKIPIFLPSGEEGVILSMHLFYKNWFWFAFLV